MQKLIFPSNCVVCARKILSAILLFLPSLTVGNITTMDSRISTSSPSDRQLLADENITTVKPPGTTRVPVDLIDIGYEGSWEQFCNPEEISKEFTLYPNNHDLRSLRAMICMLYTENKLVRQSLLAFTVYKYCSSIRPQLDGFMEKFLSILSTNDMSRRLILLVPGSQNDTSSCYEEAFTMFTRTCAGIGNPCVKMFRALLSRACNVPWLETDDVVRCVNKVCDGKFISDSVNWETIFNSISYKE